MTVHVHNCLGYHVRTVKYQELVSSMSITYSKGFLYNGMYFSSLMFLGVNMEYCRHVILPVSLRIIVVHFVVKLMDGKR